MAVLSLALVKKLKLNKLRYYMCLEYLIISAHLWHL